MARPISARRFPLRLPIVFRSNDRDPWRRAMSVSISEAAVQFLSGRRLLLGARIQMRFVVRVSSARSEVECQARVTRIARSREAGSPARYTAAIDSYRFVKLKA